MPRRNDREEPFFQRLAELMVREEKDVWVAATELNLGLTSDECRALSKNKGFQRALRAERLKLYNELANDPNRSKSTLIGQAIQCIDKLMDSAPDKALAGIITLAKIEGWVGADTNVNVFAGLTTNEMEALKAKLKRRADGDEFPNSEGNA